MKNTIITIASMLLLIGCSNKYDITYEKVVPDSLKAKATNFIIEVTRAADQHLTGGDIEDQEDVIAQAEKTVKNIYGISLPHLRYRTSDGYLIWSTPVNELTEEQRKIYNSLLSK